MSLTEFVIDFKKFARLSILATALYFVAKAGLGYGIDYYKKTRPPIVVAPEARFGLITPTKIDSIKLNQETGPIYILDTKTGKLPILPQRLKIYPAVTPTLSILAEKKVKVVATVFGFVRDPEKISFTEFKWSDLYFDRNKLVYSSRIFWGQAYNNFFSLRYDRNNPPAYYATYRAPTEEVAKSTLLELLKQANLASEEIQNSKIEIEYLNLIAGNYVSVATSEESQFTKVSITRQIKDGSELYNVASESPTSPVVYIILGQDSTMAVKVVEFKYFWHNFDFAQGSEYPTNNISNAWDKIQNNQGLLVSLYTNDAGKYENYAGDPVTKLEINEASIVYLESNNLQDLLEPYFSLSGKAKFADGKEGAFVLYYNALSPEKLKQ